MTYCVSRCLFNKQDNDNDDEGVLEEIGNEDQGDSEALQETMFVFGFFPDDNAKASNETVALAQEKEKEEEEAARAHAAAEENGAPGAQSTVFFPREDKDSKSSAPFELDSTHRRITEGNGHIAHDGCAWCRE